MTATSGHAARGLAVRDALARGNLPAARDAARLLDTTAFQSDGDSVVEARIAALSDALRVVATAEDEAFAVVAMGCST